MRERGTLAGFILGKTVLAIAVVGLVGASVSLGSNLRRQASDERLKIITRSVAGALKDVERLPGEVELVKRLPDILRDFEVTISGSWADGAETIVVCVAGEKEVRRSVVLEHKVNGGDFELSASNPRSVKVAKGPGGSLKSSGFLERFLVFWSTGEWMETPERPIPELTLELV